MHTLPRSPLPPLPSRPVPIGRNRPIWSGSNTIPNTMIAIAMWIGFSGLLVRGLGQSNDILRHMGRFFFDLSAVILIFVGLGRLFQVRRNAELSRAFLLCYGLLGASMMAGVVGIANGNDFIGWVTMGFLPLISAVCMIVDDADQLFERLCKTLLNQLWIGVFFSAYIILFDRPSGRSEWNGEYGDGLSKMAARTLYALPFLLPYFSKLRMRYQILLTIGAFEFLALNIMGANRGPLIASFIAVPLMLMVFAWRCDGNFTRVRHMAVTLSLVALGFGPIFSLGISTSPALQDYFTERVGETVARLSGEDFAADRMLEISEGALYVSRDEFLGDTSRGGELRDFIRQLEPIDYVCGRGFGGRWMSIFWGGEWPMVHIGPAHLVLVGGLPLLLAFMLLWLGAVTDAWKILAHHRAAAGALCYMMVFTMSFIQHGAVQEENELYLFWLCVGIAFSASAAVRSAHSASRPQTEEKRRLTLSRGGVAA